MDDVHAEGNASASARLPHTPAPDEQQAREQEFDGLMLARSNQELCVSGANRV